MMFRVLSKVVCKISPAASNANHNALAFAYEANKQFDGFGATGLRKMI